MKNKLTHDMIHDMVQKYNNPPEAKPVNSGDVQSQALRALIASARTRNSQALARRNNGGAFSGTV